MIKLSIITPVFNGAQFIEKCLENVGNQATDEIEHLILDGASTDETVEKVKSYAKDHPHVRLISEKDNGQSDAMNKGIELAKGSIIGFLNVDDYYEPNILPTVIPLFEGKANPSFICGNLNIWNPDGSFRHLNKPKNIRLVELASHCFEWPYNPSAYFYHKSLHRLTGPYNVDNHYCMDYEFIVEAAKHISLQYVDVLWGNFFMAEGSKTQVSHQDYANHAFKAGQDIRDKAFQSLSKSEKTEFWKILETHQTIGRDPKPKNTSLVKRVKNKISKLIGK